MMKTARLCGNLDLIGDREPEPEPPGIAIAKQVLDDDANQCAFGAAVGE